MATLPRLNGIIRALESGQHAFTCFMPPDVEAAIALQASKYDGVVFEGEHNGWDIRTLRDCLSTCSTARRSPRPRRWRRR